MKSVVTVAAFWRERLPLAGQHKRQKKAGRRCGYALSASRVICEIKVYQSPRQPLLTIVSEPPRQFPTQAVHRLSLHLLCPALAEMEMECRADQRVLDSIGKSIAVQKIGLLSGGQLVQRRTKKGRCWENECRCVLRACLLPVFGKPDLRGLPGRRLRVPCMVQKLHVLPGKGAGRLLGM